MIKIALFASGSGTNVENIARYFSSHAAIEVAAVFSNNANAYVLERAKKLELPSVVFNRSQFYDSDWVLKQLNDFEIDWIVLAGFLWLVPHHLIQAFPNRIINIHPALLPKFGGKGMYGDRVHQAVVANGENETGITVHFVNDIYDQGTIIEQKKVPVLPTDTSEMVAQKVHALEYGFFPSIIERTVLSE